MAISFQDLLKKYDVQVPRYTSYPTVPSWTATPETSAWYSEISETLNPEGSSWALYLHLPFCENLCTFCGCNTIITKNHSQESKYIDLLLKELDLYIQNSPQIVDRPLRQIHLGGGTPTFFSATHLRQLVDGIFSRVKKTTENFEASIEIDPRRTQYDQLKVLREVGFDRVSLGVQDFNEKVQVLINRKQPYEITADITEKARRLGYRSVNFDLIYGLPQQDLESMKLTVQKTLTLRPDRIALYSLALVPWIKPAQRIFQDSDLPTVEKKRELYEEARKLFLAEGYVDIGMDHFALPTDSLVLSQQNGLLHRNFMGYTDIRTDLLLGLGVSSISESRRMFHQNEKLLPKYTEVLAQNAVPTFRGHILNSTDLVVRERILKIMTQFEIEAESLDQAKVWQENLKGLEQDGLVEWDQKVMRVTAAGRPFVRNVCSYFDEHLQRSKTEVLTDKKVYSTSI